MQDPAGRNNCNDGGGGSADCHDNSVAYEWCTRLTGTVNANIALKMATSIAGKNVFLEKGHVYIDTSRIDQSGQCIAAAPPTTTTATTAADDVSGQVAVSGRHGHRKH